MGVELSMADTEDATLPCSLLDGHYHALGSFYSFIVVEGEKAVIKIPTGDTFDIKFKLGEFGEADPEIRKLTGHTKYNVEFNYKYGLDFSELGVVSKDGLKINTKGIVGITSMEWVTKEQAAILEADGDPIDAPPGPYKIQPDILGKLLWITGGPGLGKSTSAQLLCKKSGYVYY